MKISIITINLNNAIGIVKTIKSVLSQGYNDLEHIIIDGKSKDKSVQVIKKYKSLYAKFRGGLTWYSEADSGVYNAMNKGIRLAKGEFCYFLNSGDTLHDNNVLSDIFSPDISRDLIYGKIINNKNLIEYPEKIDTNFFLAHTLIHQAVFIKRKLFSRIGLYDESLKYVSDWKFFLSLFRSGGCTTNYRDRIIAFYDNTGITSQKKNLHLIDQEKDKVREALFPALFREYKNIQQHSCLNSTNIWKLISAFVEYDQNEDKYVIQISDEAEFYRMQLWYLNQQYDKEVNLYKNLYEKMRKSKSYRLGNVLFKLISKFKII